MESNISGFPTAMCVSTNTLYFFLKGAIQRIYFSGPDVITVSRDAPWGTPSAAACDDCLAYVTADNGIFSISLDDYMAITQINTENWTNTHALAVYGEHLYAVCKAIYKISKSEGSYSKYNSEDWDYMTCGVRYGDYLFMASCSSPGHLYKYNIPKNSYKSISTGWENSKAITVYGDQIFIIAKKTWFVDPDEGTYREGSHGEWKNSKVCVGALGSDIFAVTNARRLWKLNNDGGYKQIKLGWTVD